MSRDDENFFLFPARICRSHPDILNCFCISRISVPAMLTGSNPERLHSMYIPNKAAVVFRVQTPLFRRRIQLNHIRLPRGISHHCSNVFSGTPVYEIEMRASEIGYEFTDEVTFTCNDPLSAASCCIFTFCIPTPCIAALYSYCFLFPAYVLLHQIYSL